MLQSQPPKFNFTCDYRIGDINPAICLWQSKRLGQIIKTTHLFCNQCPSNVYQNKNEDPAFLKKCLNRRYNDTFVNKLYNKYTEHTKIILPNNWTEISNSFNILKQENWFVDLGLTGSYIVKGVENHKDIDIILWINNIIDYLNWIEYNTLPGFILDSIKVDYYLFLEPHYQFFVSLWPNQKKIFTSSYFHNNISCDDETLEIVYNNTLDKILDFTN
jgi:hypothetical protein